MTFATKKTVIICPIHKTYFSGRLWLGLNYNKIKTYLESLSCGVDVKVIELYKIIDKLDTLNSGSVLFFSTSYDSFYRKYICDIIRFVELMRPDIKTIPSYDMLLAHENKGFQELYKKKLNIENVPGDYFGDITDFDRTIYDDFPYVIKLLEGSMSTNVFLANDYTDLIRSIKKRRNKNVRYDLKRFFKNYVINKKYKISCDEFSNYNFDEFFQTRTPFVVQKFIPDLTYDYKILVFGIKYYVLKRYIRENDFRASGSGNFAYESVPFHVLDYAKILISKFKSPFLSLDIAEQNGVCYLIEYQGIGFGPVTLENSTGYYSFIEKIDGTSWFFVEEKPNLEFSYAESILSVI